MSLVIKPGVYRTRDGNRATVYAVGMRGGYSVKGVLHLEDRDEVSDWTASGAFYGDSDADSLDLVSEWIETPEVDWSAIPFRFVAMDEGGVWFGYYSKPDQMTGHWEPHKQDEYYHSLSLNHNPKWNGDWRQSLVERPEGK